MIERIDALAADIDMTLTAKGMNLHETVKEAFDILHRNGVLLGLATGREIDDKLKHQGSLWGLDYEFDFIIGMNGGMIYNLADDSMWSTDLMTREELKEILLYMLPLIDEHEISINAEGGGNHNAMYIRGELLASARRHGFMFEDKTGDVDGFCEKPAYKILFRTTPETIDLVKERFLAKYGENYQIIGTFPGTVEVMHKGIDKGSGMKRYADEHGLDMANVIAFGDNENDNTLLEMCGWGVCLKNGSDGTKACADAITEYECSEGGAGHYLFDHYLKPHHMA